MNTDGKVWNHPKLSKSTSYALNSAVPTFIPVDFKINKKATAMDIFRQNTLTLLGVSYSSFSDPAIESFVEAAAFNSNFCNVKLPKLIIKPILNPLKWLLWSQLIPATENSFTIWGDIPFAIEIFGMENKFAGYVFLIDSHGMIKWKAAGVATANELKSFNATINAHLIS